MFRKSSCLLLYGSFRKTENIYFSYPNLDNPDWKNPELTMFMDGKSFINQRQQRAGCSGDPSAIIHCQGLQILEYLIAKRNDQRGEDGMLADYTKPPKPSFQ